MNQQEKEGDGHEKRSRNLNSSSWHMRSFNRWFTEFFFEFCNCRKWVSLDCHLGNRIHWISIMKRVQPTRMASRNFLSFDAVALQIRHGLSFCPCPLSSLVSTFCHTIYFYSYYNGYEYISIFIVMDDSCHWYLYLDEGYCICLFYSELWCILCHTLPSHVWFFLVRGACKCSLDLSLCRNYNKKMCIRMISKLLLIV